MGEAPLLVDDGGERRRRVKPSCSGFGGMCNASLGRRSSANCRKGRRSGLMPMVVAVSEHSPKMGRDLGGGGGCPNGFSVTLE